MGRDTRLAILKATASALTVYAIWLLAFDQAVSAGGILIVVGAVTGALLGRHWRLKDRAP
jgi:hypothetical protein